MPEGKEEKVLHATLESSNTWPPLAFCSGTPEPPAGHGSHCQSPII